MSEKEIENYILKASSKVATLVDLVEETSRAFSIPKYKVLRVLSRLVDEEKIYIQNPKIPNSFMQYLLSSYSQWFLLVVLADFMTLASIYLLPQTFPVILIRYFFSGLFLLYLPGYTLIEALFPKKEDMGSIERFALSVSLSLAIAPLIGYIFNFTVWGIRLEPIATALTIWIMCFAILALMRKYYYFRLANI
ncbi:MAG TPA: DUF1616 domain-containing protein [Geobacterales bacterium]|nr:DUF1616 domain-containing protein [Geobacterales bacterium]